MRLCTTHDQQLRARFMALGYEIPSDGEVAQKFHAAHKRDLLNGARANIIDAAIREAPELLGLAHACPICYLVKPSWIEEAIQGQIALLKQC